MKQPRITGGKFGSQYKERRGDVIALRLPQSLDEALRAAAGDNLKTWVEEAIALKLKHEGFLTERNSVEASSQQLEQGQLSNRGSGTEEPAAATGDETPASRSRNAGGEKHQAGDAQPSSKSKRSPGARAKTRKAAAS